MRYSNTKKIEKIKISPNNYYVVLDFDKTLTSKESLDSWMAVLDFDIYGEECKKKIEQINAKYAPVELDYTLDKKTKEKYITEWYQKSIDFLYDHQLTKSNLKKALQKEPIKFRKGAKEFLQELQQENIPVIIISAGIGNVIEEFLKNQECYGENIYIISNFIQFKDDKMQKFNQSLIHSMNKNSEGKLPKDWIRRLKQKEHIILCGDLIEDIKMIPERRKESSILVGFLNSEIKKNLSLYKQNYDIVLTEEEANFYEVEKIIKERKEEEK